MTAKFASAKHSIAECDRCGFRFKLNQLKALTIKTKQVNILVCQECWEADHPQLQLGMYPVSDPQAVENPRPDQSYYEAGNNGAGGSRHIQWGWQPVGGAPEWTGIENLLLARGEVGTVTITDVLGPDMPVNVTSTTGTSGLGNVGLSYDDVFDVSGLESTTELGLVGVYSEAVLSPSGVDATSALGSVTAGSPSTSVTVSATGVAGTGELGNASVVSPLILIFNTLL